MFVGSPQMRIDETWNRDQHQVGAALFKQYSAESDPDAGLDPKKLLQAVDPLVSKQKFGPV